MARENMPAAIARGLPISVGDVLKARQRPHLSERFRRIHRRQHGPEVWVFGRRQQPMPGLRPSLGQSLRQAKPPFRREALRQCCPILSRCKHRPNPYKPPTHTKKKGGLRRPLSVQRPLRRRSLALTEGVNALKGLHKAL